jgi:hypothetical protein
VQRGRDDRQRAKAENFNQVNVAGKPVNDLHDSFLIKMPLPAGWKIGGPWGIHPVDPYGHALYAQYNGMGSGSLYFGISAFGGNKVSPAYCMKYVMLIIRNFDKLNRRMSGHPNAACIANPTTTSCNCISPITGMGHYYNLNMR